MFGGNNGSDVANSGLSYNGLIFLKNGVKLNVFRALLSLSFTSNLIQMKALLILFLSFCSITFCPAQGRVVTVMDELRYDWDAKIEFVKTYDDLKNLCRNRDFRRDLMIVLDKIHHLDSMLYRIVNKKFAESSDPEAKATLDDIQKLERDYTSKGFRTFVHKECNEYNFVENNFRGFDNQYETEKTRIEIELKKYLPEITKQVDVIDEHAHHLKL